MPQTGMDWWVIAGVAIAGITALIAWRQLRKKDTPRTTNAIKNGNRNSQTGGAGETRNSIEGGDDNTQSGARLGRNLTIQSVTATTTRRSGITPAMSLLG